MIRLGIDCLAMPFMFIYKVNTQPYFFLLKNCITYVIVCYKVFMLKMFLYFYFCRKNVIGFKFLLLNSIPKLFFKYIRYLTYYFVHNDSFMIHIQKNKYLGKMKCEINPKPQSFGLHSKITLEIYFTKSLYVSQLLNAFFNEMIKLKKVFLVTIEIVYC